MYGGSTILIGSGAAIYHSVDSLEDVKQVGLIRFGRAAVAVSYSFLFVLSVTYSTSRYWNN